MYEIRNITILEFHLILSVIDSSGVDQIFLHVIVGMVGLTYPPMIYSILETLTSYYNIDID